jgi:hypothetical protein
VRCLSSAVCRPAGARSPSPLPDWRLESRWASDPGADGQREVSRAQGTKISSSIKLPPGPYHPFHLFDPSCPTPPPACKSSCPACVTFGVCSSPRSHSAGVLRDRYALAGDDWVTGRARKWHGLRCGYRGGLAAVAAAKRPRPCRPSDPRWRCEAVAGRRSADCAKPGNVDVLVGYCSPWTWLAIFGLA